MQKTVEITPRNVTTTPTSVRCDERSKEATSMACSCEQWALLEGKLCVQGDAHPDQRGHDPEDNEK